MHFKGFTFDNQEDCFSLYIQISIFLERKKRAKNKINRLIKGECK